MLPNVPLFFDEKSRRFRLPYWAVVFIYYLIIYDLLFYGLAEWFFILLF